MEKLKKKIFLVMFAILTIFLVSVLCIFNFQDYNHEKVEIENKLSYARSNYNNVVTSYNNLVESIPSNIIAKIFVFEKKELFKLDVDKKEDIKIKF